MTEGDVRDSKRVNYGKVIAEGRSETLFHGWAGECEGCVEWNSIASF